MESYPWTHQSYSIATRIWWNQGEVPEGLLYILDHGHLRGFLLYVSHMLDS